MYSGVAERLDQITTADSINVLLNSWENPPQIFSDPKIANFSCIPNSKFSRLRSGRICAKNTEHLPPLPKLNTNPALYIGFFTLNDSIEGGGIWGFQPANQHETVAKCNYTILCK